MPTHGDWKDLFKACSEGKNTNLVSFHLRNGVDPDFQHPEYFTAPLFEAIRAGHSDVVRILVEQGKANVNLIESLTDQTPLQVAMESKRHDLVDYLIDHGSQTEVKDDDDDGAIKIVKRVLITGGYRGIGREIAANILHFGHQVVITCRTQEIGRKTIQELREETGNSKISFLVGDLSSIRSTHILATQIKEKFPQINVLIHNADILWPTELVINEDGLEMAFMVNYIAPKILSDRLLPTLQTNGPDSRIVLITGGLFFLKGQPDIAKTPFGRDFHSIMTYAHTKQCNVFFFQDMAQDLIANNGKVDNVTMNAVHPGVIRTALGLDSDDMSGFLGCILRLIQRFCKTTPSQGEIIMPVRLALDVSLRKTNGVYFNGGNVLKISESVRDENVRKKWKLWTDEFLQKTTPTTTTGEEE